MFSNSKGKFQEINYRNQGMAILEVEIVTGFSI